MQNALDNRLDRFNVLCAHTCINYLVRGLIPRSSYEEFEMLALVFTVLWRAREAVRS